MNEQELTRKCSKWLRKQNDIFWLKIHGGGPMQRKGLADYWIVVEGTSIQVELKRPGGKPQGSQLQEKLLRSHDSAGGVSCVATSLEALQAIIDFYRGKGDDGLGVQYFIELGELREVFYNE